MIEGTNYIVVRNGLGKVREIESVELPNDKDIDLALLILKKPFPSNYSLSIEDIKTPKAGEQIYVMGYPMSSILGRYNPSISQGIISKTSGFGEMAGEFQITAKMNKGNSGGPIFNDKGQIIGISVGKLNKSEVLKKDGFIPEDVNVGISGPVVLNFLNMPIKASIQEEIKYDATEIYEFMRPSVVFNFLHLKLFLNFYSHYCSFLIHKGEGMSYWDDKTSKKEACDKAELEAKDNVLTQLGLERIKSTVIEACSDSGDKASCVLYQSTFNTISGGYIKNFELLEKGRGGIENKYCVVKIIAEAFKYKGEHDQEFIINANIGDKRRFFEGSNIVINAELSQEAFINVLAWYPETDKENYHKLYPNQYEENNFLKDKFNIPTKNTNTKYQSVFFLKILKKMKPRNLLLYLQPRKNL